MTGKCQEILNQLKCGNPNHILVPRNKFKWIWFSPVEMFEMDKIMKKTNILWLYFLIHHSVWFVLLISFGAKRLKLANTMVSSGIFLSSGSTYMVKHLWWSSISTLMLSGLKIHWPVEKFLIITCHTIQAVFRQCIWIFTDIAVWTQFLDGNWCVEVLNQYGYHQIIC